MKYIQNRTNWCWVAACKVVGEQYKKNFVDAWQSAIAKNADFLHGGLDRKSTRLNSSHYQQSRMPSSA